MPEENRPLLAAAHHDPESGHETDGNSGRSKVEAYRDKTAEFLETRTLHVLVIGLITIDALCVLIDVGYAFLSESCTPAEGPEAPAWLEVLSQISLVITTFFLIEIPITLWAFGSGFYNPISGVHHASLHLFDTIIILTTFILEVFLKGRERELASLLVLLRLWRLVKLVGGIAVGAGELEEQTAKELEVALKRLKVTQDELAQARKENEELQKKLWLHEPAPSTEHHPS